MVGNVARCVIRHWSVLGEIYDETDRDVLAGRFPIHDLTDVGIDDVPPGEYATIAGFVLDRLGRLPDTPGDTIRAGAWSVEVVAITRHAITDVRVRRVA